METTYYPPQDCAMALQSFRNGWEAREIYQTHLRVMRENAKHPTSEGKEALEDSYIQASSMLLMLSAKEREIRKGELDSVKKNFYNKLESLEMEGQIL